MGAHRKTDRLESLHLAAKGSLTLAAFVAALISCSSPQKPLEPASGPETPAAAQAPLGTRTAVDEDQWKQGLSRSGLSDRPVLSRDGRKVLFISRERSLHRQRQLYEVHLETKEERRLTFQDGDVHEVVVNDDDGTVYYTSTTDQIKERPALFYPEVRTALYPLTDIYRMRASHDVHERLTDTPAYEGFLHYHNEGTPFLTASRQLNDELLLIRTNAAGKPGFEIFLQKPGFLLHSLTTFPKKRIRAWVEEDKKTGHSTIQMTVRGQKPIEHKTGLVEVRDLQILENGDEILLTGKSEKGQLRQAFWMKLKDKCLQAMMPVEATIADLKLSGDQKTLLWTMIRGERSQIFAAPLTAPTTTCEPIRQ